MVKIYMMSGNDAYRDRAVEICDGFISKRRIAEDGCGPLISELGISGNKIMLVDDNKTLGEAFAARLSDDCEVHYFADVIEALQKYDGLSPDVILVDIEMPVKNGFDFVKDVKSRGAYMGVPQ